MTRNEQRMTKLIHDLRYGYTCFNALLNNNDDDAKTAQGMVNELSKLASDDRISLPNRAYAQGIALTYNHLLLMRNVKA